MPKSADSDRVAFTSHQKELWLACQASLQGEVDSRGYFYIDTRVCRATVEQAQSILLDHFPLLRARIHLQGKEPFFELNAADPFKLTVLDFSKEPDPETSARAFAEGFFDQPLADQPLRAALLHTSERASMYALKASHIAMDGIAMAYFMDLLAEVYQSLVLGEKASLGEPCSPYALLEADEKHFSSSRVEQDTAFWEEHLEQLPDQRIFRARPGFPDVLGQTRHKRYAFSAAESHPINMLVERHNVSPSTLFTALHALAVGFMCDEHAVIVQTPVAFGERKKRAQRQGHQIALPPVHLDLSRFDSFGALLDEIEQQNKQFFRHVRTPYQLAMRELKQKKFTHLADGIMNFLSYSPQGNREFPIRTYEQMHSAKDEVVLGTMIIPEESASFGLNVRSSCNHLSEQDVARYVTRMAWLAEQLAAGVELAELNYILKEEAQELLQWQQGELRNNTPQTIPERFDETAAAYASKPAVKDELGASISYAELQEHSLRCAAWLTSQGVKKGNVVGVVAKRSLRLYEILLGIMRIGAVYLPLDPKSPPERLEHIVNDAEAVLTMDLDQVDYAPVDPSALPSGAAPHDGAYLIYTSGSTGRPKGVLVPHDGFLNMIQGQIDIVGITDADHVLQFASPAFDASLSEIFMTLLSGACLYPVSDHYRNAPWTLKEYMREHAVSVVTFPPSYLHLFNQEPFPGLRVLITAGEAPIADDALHYAGQLDYFNAYGPTEACVCASIKKVSTEETPPLSVGKPLPNMTACILNSAKQPLPAGMVGELWIGGASLACGYYKNEALTAERFQTVPGLDAARLYATGDRALWSESGEIVLVGRSDDQVKIRGNRVEPGEVAFLLESNDEVEQAFVLAEKDAEGRMMLAAFVVLRDGGKMETLTRWSLEHLPVYMVPSFWQALDAMPVTVTGKVDRAALKHRVAHAAKSVDAPTTGDSELVPLFEAALDGKYNPRMDFFAQGGDSLKAMALLHEIQEKLGVEISFRSFAACEDLAAVEALLQQGRPKASAEEVKKAPLSRNQFQLWAYQQSNANSIDYNMPFLMEVDGRLSERFVDALCRALTDQPLLRCTIDGEIDAPYFAENRAAHLQAEIQELDSEAAAADYFDRLVHTPFDLRKEPPVKVAAARFANRLQLLVLIHHIAGDAETLSIILRNAVRYLHHQEGVKGRLSTQVEFCRREKEYERSAEFEADRAYWNAVFAEPLPLLHPSKKRKGAMAIAALDAEFVAHLEATARKAGGSLLNTFIALLGTFLRKKYGRQELLIGVPVGLRETQEEFNAAGFYVNTAAVRLRGAVDFSAAVQETSAQFKAALAHSRYCISPAAPDVLATQAALEDITEDGLSVKSVELHLNASKFTASFTLDSGSRPRLILEYDQLFISDGAQLLEEFKQYIAALDEDLPERSRAQILAEAWHEILRAEARPESDFFRAGGDSIKAIQITGILHRNGIKTLSASDFFETPTFAALCGLLEDDRASEPAQEYISAAPGKTVPLLPLQAALMAKHPAHWKIFYMMLPMELGKRIEPSQIESWLHTLPSRFEALRLAFSSDGATLLAEPQKIQLKHCFFDSGESRVSLFRKALRLITAELDPEQGRTFGAALAEQDESRFLILAGHHLVLDAVSLDILRQDLENQGALRETFGVATKAVEVEKRVRAGEFPTQQDRVFWQSVCATPAGKLSALNDAQQDLAADRRFELKQLKGLRADFMPSALADLLAALSNVLHEHGQRDSVFVTLESHGRDALLPAFDTSNSLGWFTAVCPMPLAAHSSLEAAQQEILPWIQEHFNPLSCNAFGYLKREAPEAFGYDAQIGINYFGQRMDLVGDFTPLFDSAMPGQIPELIHPDFEPDSPLELIVYFDASGVLNLGAYFSPKVLASDWVNGLLDTWISTLKQLPAYQEILPEELQTRIREISCCEADDVEALCPPDACHEPMLYQHLSAQDATYTQQIEFYFKGEVDDLLFTKAWYAVVARHESLRSLFPMPYDGEFYRLVLRRPRISVEHFDLSSLPEPLAAAKKMERLAEERQRGFDLNTGPLLRAQFYRLAPDRFMFSWCFHHLLMDGWCIGILLRELFVTYNSLLGKSAEHLPDPLPLAEYARRRAGFDKQAARNYWAALLDGFESMTSIAAPAPQKASSLPRRHEFVVDETLTEKLKAVARSQSVTLPILIQSLWALVLSSENASCRDVVYGVVNSGRPADLPGIDQTVGLFIQTLPVRAAWSKSSSFSELSASVKAQSLRHMEHGHLPLPEIGRNLFDHLLVFENYPYETQFGDGSVELLEVNGFEKIPYPLGISVVPQKTILFRFLYDPESLTDEVVRTISEKLFALLKAVADNAEISCRMLEEKLSGIGAAQRSRAGTLELQSAVQPVHSAEPPDDIEAGVLEIYRSVLNCSVPSIDANFFHLGGHSLLAMRVLALVSKRFGVSLTVEEVLSNYSVRLLAGFIRKASAGTAEKMVPAVEKEIYPLSSSQMRIWFLQRMHEDRKIYLIPFAARLNGAVDRELLQEALSLLEARHEALRMRVSSTEPKQKVLPPGQLKLDCLETTFDPVTPPIEAMEFGFDNPLINVTLFRESDERAVLFFCVHHIVFDGWSGEIFVKELNQAYRALLQGKAPEWTPLDVGFAAYVDQSATQEPAGLETIREALLPLPESLNLPLDTPRPSLQSFNGAVRTFSLSEAQSRRLKAYAAESGVTLFPVLLALIKTFLFRHTGQDDLIVGCPAANREQEQVQDMIGLFVNTLAIRTRLRKEQGFAALVKDVDAVFRSMLSTQRYPFEKVLDNLKIERAASRNPLFDVFVALEGAAWSNWGQEPLAMQPIELRHDRSKFDLSFYFKETAAGFDVHIEYCTDLFKAETIDRMSERLTCLLDAVLRDQTAPLATLNIIPPSELALLECFNQTAEPFDIEHDIDSCFRRQLQKTPNALAIRESAGGSCTYQELDALVSNLAVWLQSKGVACGDYVGVCFDRSLEMMTTIFAVTRLGATYVPLSASLPESRIRSIFEDLGSCAVVCDAAFADQFAAAGQPVFCPDIRNLPASSSPAVSIDPGSVAYTIFTSGSTGRPKGVLVEHRSLLNRILWMQSRFPIGEGDVILQKTTVSFDVSVWELFWWSWVGAGLALLEPNAEKDPGRIVKAIAEHKVTVMHFVPSMLRAFLDYLEAFPEKVPQLSSLRYVFASGEALPRDLVVRFQALLSAELHNLYGPTEAAIDVTWYPCVEPPSEVIPIGRPVSNTQMHVLDEHLQRVPLGVVGELYISGVQVARGYANREDLTAERFLNDPLVEGNRMYRTGDLGRWTADGNIEYLGRNDDQVKVRGFRIELGEVEAALDRCSGVSQAVVRVRKIGGYDSLEAFLLPHENAVLSGAQIRHELAGYLPEYMCPGILHEVDEIPLSPSGKADRKRIQGRPLTVQKEARTETLTALQQEIKALWLKVIPEAEALDIDQGFFEVGGNSLLLLDLHQRFEERWPGVFSIAALFAESTIRRQAESVEQLEAAPSSISRAAEINAPIAIIGMAVRLGDYDDTESFWKDLAAGIDKNRELPLRRRQEVRQILEAVGLEYNEAQLREASYLSDISGFDYKRFGLSPNDAGMIDPQQRIFLETALQALDDAGYGGTALQNQKVATFVGASPLRLFQDAVTRAFPDQSEQTYLLNVPSNVVARISYLKNWSGPGGAVDTACSSTLKALHDACVSLKTGESSVALVGGVNVINLPMKTNQTFAIEASSGQTRTFDAKADGVGAGEGAAVFVLKRLDQALKDHDAVHAVIAGSAVNQDGRSSSIAAPNPIAQAEVIAQAAQNASLVLTDLDFFEAHGTATVLGDPVEIEGISRAFMLQGVTPEKKALIGSVKGNIGHLDAAAGALGLAKAVVSLKNGMVPPQPYFERPNPHINFDAAPVRVAQSLEKLSEENRPWRCGVSSFGLSGVNAHVILAEAAAPTIPEEDGAWYCVPLSASDEAGFLAYAQQVRDAVRRNEAWPLHAIAATLMSGREALPVRAVVVASSRQELIDALAEEIIPECVSKVLDEAVYGAGFETKAEALHHAEAFLRGQALRWPEERAVYRVHLPPTPFHRTTLWPKFKTNYLSKPLCTPQGTAFSVAIGKPDFWPVAEHRLNEVPTLVGMGMVDLIAAAVGSVPLSIEKLSWHRPVCFVEGNEATLLLKKTQNATSVELQHFHAGTWQLAASANVLPNERGQSIKLDLPVMRAALQPVEVEGELTMISVSQRWNCRKGLWVSEAGDRLMTHLMLDNEFKSDLYSFKWHPAMLDLASSLALHNVSGFVPARCGRMNLYKPLPAEIYAYVEITDKKPQMITADCTVTDVSGQVLLEMNELVFLSLQKPKSEPELYELQWTRAELNSRSPKTGVRTLLLGSEAHALYGALKEISVAQQSLPAEVEERNALAQQIQAEAIDQLVCLLAENEPHCSFCSQMQEISRSHLKRPIHVTVVGSGAFSGHHAPPDGALALGMMLSLKQEEPLISCSYVELESLTPEAIQTLKSCIGRMDGPSLIRSDGAVCLQSLSRVTTAPKRHWNVNGCVVISGGLGGMGLTLAEQLTAETNARVVLLHRRSTLEQNVPYASYFCDITDSDQVRTVFAEIRNSLGPIKGIIHAAGVAGEGYLSSKTQQAYESVLAPKVAGTWNLHEVSLDDELEFFVMASSRTALVGAPGQCDYTAANAYLNGFASYRRAQGLPALSICWNSWSDVGMAARMQTANNGYALRPEQAFSVLDQALAYGGEQVVVAMSDEDVTRYTVAKIIHEEAAPAPVEQTIPFGVSEAEVLEVFRDCLGYDQALTLDDDFYELGGDSISATQIVSKINEISGASLSVMDLLDCNTIGEVVAQVVVQPAQVAAPVKVGIQPAPERDTYPVGREQLSILYAELLSGRHTGFNLPIFMKLPPDVDRERLEQAVGALIERHEVLRTSFCDFDQEHPNMRIHPAGSFKLETLELADWSEKDALIRPFDVKSGDLFRVKLLMVNQTDCILFFDIHHALADGRTISLLNADLFALYHQRELKPVGPQQKDIAWHQFTHPSAVDKAYWMEQFEGALPLLDLPSDFKRPATHTNRGDHYEFELSAALVEGIGALSRKAGVTRYTIALAAWSLLIHKYTGDEDFVIAITSDSRGENLNTAGMLASLLPLRMKVNDAQPMSEVLQEAQRVSNDARRHSSYILNDLLTELHPPVHRDRTLLSEVILSYMNFEFGNAPNQLFETLRFHNPASKADLSIFASDSGGRIGFVLEYYADLFSAANVVKMARDFETILQEMVFGDLANAPAFEYAPEQINTKETAEKELSRELSAQIRRYAEAQATPVDAVILTTLAALISRVAAKSDLLIDYQAAVPIRFAIGEETEFSELLAHTHQSIIAGPQPIDNRTDDGFMKTAFVYNDAPVRTDYGLICFVAESAKGLLLRFTFDPNQLTTETAQNWLGYFELFLKGIVGGNR